MGHFRNFCAKYPGKLLTNLFVLTGVSGEDRAVSPFLNPGLAVLLFSVRELITDEMINQAIMNPDVRVSLSLRRGFFRDPEHLRHARAQSFDPEALKTCPMCGLILPLYCLSNVDQVALTRKPRAWCTSGGGPATRTETG